MSHDGKADSAYEYIYNIITPVLMVAAAAMSLYMFKDIFFGIWQVLRLIEFSLLTVLQYPLKAIGFEGEAYTGFRMLLSVKPTELNIKMISSFESRFNDHLRFIYAAIIFFIAYRTYKNYHTVTHRFTLDDILTVYAGQSEMLNQLIDDNPLDHPINFQFDNRSDYANRHSKNISPSQMLTCNPILLATPEETQRAYNSPELSRPICIFDRENNTFDFNQALCETSLMRQVTGIPYSSPFYSNISDVPRLFDSNGVMLPLKTEKRSGKTVYIGNFRQNNLLNNGFDYCGSDDDIQYLFSSNERWVFNYLKDVYRGSEYLFEQAARDLLKCHAYSRTYLVELLSVTRSTTGGAATIASTEFLRVKQRDRVLYYALLDSDEEMYSYDSIAVIAHHSMEKALKEKTNSVFIRSAIRVLRQDAQRLSNWTAPDHNVMVRKKYSFSLGDDDKDVVKKKLSSSFDVDLDDLAEQKRKNDEKTEVLI